MNLEYFLNPTLKVLNLTHYDLDGAASHLVLKNVYHDITYIEMRYGYVEESVGEQIPAISDGYDCIIASDYYPEKIMGILRGTGLPILVLDHHPTAMKYNDPANGIIIDTSKCGAMLCYDFFKAHFDLIHLSVLIGYVDVLDRWQKNDPRFAKAQEINELLKEKYTFDSWIQAYSDGHTEMTPEESEWLKQHAIDLDKEYSSLDIKDLPENGALTYFAEHTTEMTLKLQQSGKYKYYINLNKPNGNPNADAISIAFRGFDPIIDFSKYTKRFENEVPGVLSCGGHALASGAYCRDMESAMNLVMHMVEEIVKQINGSASEV